MRSPRESTARDVERVPIHATAGLPNLIGIGVPKAGTTWLHHLLDSHPDVWMPSRREVSYFNRHYDRGLEWYQRFFPGAQTAKAYAVIGEITPRYLYSSANARRIAELGSVRRLLLILRNPVDRAYSDYWFRVRIKNYQGSFKQFLEDRPEALELGFYSRHLPAYLEYFDRSELLVLLFERAIQDIPAVRRQLANFLGIEVTRFPAGAGQTPVNERFIPRLPWLYTHLVAFGAYLRRRDADWAIHAARRVGLIRAAGSATGTRIKATIDPHIRQRLVALYRSEIDNLENLLHMDLTPWRA